jgi:multiple sugar transport system permease protein
VKSANKKAGTITAYVIIALGALIMIAPFYFMFIFATHPRDEIFNMPPPLLPGNAVPMNWGLLLRRVPFPKNFGWSVYISVFQTALTLLFCSMGGFAFSMYDFKFKKQVFALVLGTMLLPAFLGMVPTFMLMDFLGWLDQPRALIIPGAAGALGIFMMRQYITSSIPKELVEAARCDGCSEFRIYWNVVAPLLGPVFGTLGLITFIGSWNNFMGPLIVMRSVDHYTIPLALRSMQDPQNTPWGAVMLGAAAAVLPLMVLFIFSSRRLIAGLTAGALKG